MEDGSGGDYCHTHGIKASFFAPPVINCHKCESGKGRKVVCVKVAQLLLVENPQTALQIGIFTAKLQKKNEEAAPANWVPIHGFCP